MLKVDYLASKNSFFLMKGEIYMIIRPKMIQSIDNDMKTLGYETSCTIQTGTLLRTLAASKRNGSFLELGTGAGMSTAWILDGMDEHSTLTSVDRNPKIQNIAKKYFNNDDRITFMTESVESFMTEYSKEKYDFIFIDFYPGRLSNIDSIISSLQIGGLFIIDDLSIHPHLDDEESKKLTSLIHSLENRNDLVLTKIDWSTGILIATKII